MKTKVINFEMQKGNEITLPACFSAPIREDIIHKVFEAGKKEQPYGPHILAGKEVSASGKQKHRRHVYKTLYGYGISRVPRKVLSRRGERFGWVGAYIPGTVGGRPAHPPKSFRKLSKINKKESQLALRSAIAACASKEAIAKKYAKTKIPTELPIVIDSSILKKKTKDLAEFFLKLGIKKTEKKIRAGKGKMRGRKYKKTSSALVVISSNENEKNLKNFIDFTKAKQISVQALAPGGVPGRIVIWTEKSIEEIKKSGI